MMMILLAICASSTFISLVICEPLMSAVVLRDGSTNGPFWHNNQLFFVDPPAHKLCSYHPNNRDVFCVTIGSGYISFAVPVRNQPNKFVVSYDKKLFRITWNSFEDDEGPKYSEFIKLHKRIQEDSINVGMVDPTGRLWFGTMNVRGSRWGSVWSFSPVTQPELTKHMLQGNDLSNGLVWHNEDPNKFYYIDAITNRVLLYSFNQAQRNHPHTDIIFDLGAYRGTRLSINARLGRPAIDRRGWLWVPVFGASGVLEIDPYRRKMERFIEIPASKVSACAFGGSDLDVLYVTTVTVKNSNSRKDHGGKIFALSHLGEGVKGYAETPFVLN